MTGLPVVGQQQLRAAIPSGKSIFDYIQYVYALYNTKEVVMIPYKGDDKKLIVLTYQHKSASSSN